MTIGSYASDYNQGQILKGLVEGEIPINLAANALGTGSVARLLAEKLRERVSVDDFGAIPDGVTDSGPAIAKATKYLLSEYGGGILEFGRGHYRWSSAFTAPVVAAPLVIPSNVIWEGAGRNATILERLDTTNSRGLVMGTYGPANGQSPRLETKYSLQDAADGDDHVTMQTAGDGNTSGLVAGDLVSIEGATTAIQTGFYLPNMITRVAARDGDTIYLDDQIDDGGGIGTYILNVDVRPAIRKLNTGLVGSNNTDLYDGTLWPAFVATDCGIRRMTIKQNQSIGWSLPNLSCMDAFIEDCNLYCNRFSGNPVAHFRVRNCNIFFARLAYEFAYLSHDIELDNVRFYRVADDAQNATPTLWLNTGEGAKRINLNRIFFSEWSRIANTPGYAVNVESNSRMRNSRIRGKAAAVMIKRSVVETSKLVAANHTFVAELYAEIGRAHV